MKVLSAAAVLWASFGLATARPVQSAQRRTNNKTDGRPKKAEKIETTELPIAIVNAASADRLLNDVQDVFKTSGKPEIYDMIKGFLGNYGNLKGVDRKKPFGLMLFLETGIPPSVTPVGYLPVANLADLLRTIATGPFTTRKLDGKNNYEIIGVNNTIYMTIQDKYAYFSNKQGVLDRTFPEPAELTRNIASRYDIAVSVNLNSIAKESRLLFATILRTAAEAEIQQRDDEPAPAYEARRARSLRDLEWIEAFLLDCEKVLIGLDASTKSRRIVVEAAVEAREKSKLAKMIKTLGGKRSYFDSLFNEKSPLLVSVSLGMNDSEKTLITKQLRLAAAAIAYGLDPSVVDTKKKKKAEKVVKPDPKDIKPKERRPGRRRFRRPRRNWPKGLKYPTNTPISLVAESLIATAEKGHADFFLQFVGQAPEKFSIIAGLQVQDGRKLAGAMKNLFDQVKKRENAPPIKVNAETHRGVNFHRIDFPRIPPQMAQFFGAKPSVLIGASSKAVWVCIGTEDAFPRLKKAIDIVFEKRSVGKAKKTVAPFRVAINVSHWLAMIGDGNGRRNPVIEVAKKAFEKGGDGIRLEMQTTEKGFRVRAQLDEGFIRFLGLGVSRYAEARRKQQQGQSLPDGRLLRD